VDPVKLLSEHPALPATWVEGGAPRSIEWERSSRGGRVELPSCSDAAAAFREWSEGGLPRATPNVDHSVCAYADEAAANEAYDSMSLRDVAGEDWPNLEYGADADIVPADVSSLDGLEADEWEIGCGIGEPDQLCAVWTFRARYGDVIADVEFSTSGGGIGFSEMRDLVRSIDREVGARTRRN
jgi:hypothetical protein